MLLVKKGAIRLQQGKKEIFSFDKRFQFYFNRIVDVK